MLQVFISSTKQDLEEHRKAVKEAVLKAKMHPLEMGDFVARAEGPVAVCFDEIDGADALIGIYAWRYGWVPQGMQLSITEQEFDRARERNIPCFCFVVADGFPWPESLRDTGEAAAHLEAFKKKVGALTLCRFTTPDKLATDVLATLTRFRDEQKERAAASWTADPQHHRLRELFENATRRAKAELAARTGPGVLEVGLEWRRHRPAGGSEEADVTGQPLPQGDLRALWALYNRLLVLGEAGSGKTVSLLRLVCDLNGEVARAAQPPPIPVHLSLGSWRRTESGDFAEWLRAELVEEYSRTSADARRWIESGQLLPLLDGLDEVTAEERSSCVAAINRFLDAPGGPLIVASRIAEYEEIEEPLHLQAEVVLQTLGEREVAAALAAEGTEIETLEAELREQEWLRELAGTPLFLEFLRERLEGGSGLALEPLLTTAPENRRRKLLEASVDLRLTRSETETYRRERTRRSLTWLGRQLRAHRVTRFEIEALQPTWLASAPQRWLYAVLTRALVGALMALPILLVFRESMFLILCGAVAGGLIGVIDAFPGWGAAQSHALRGHLRTSALRALIAGAVTLGVSLPIAWLWIETPLGQSATLALLFALVFGTRPAGLKTDTRLLEEMSWRWSWRGALVGLAAAPAAVFLLAGLAQTLPESVGGFGGLSLAFWGTLGLLIAPVGFALGGYLGGLDGKVLELRKRRNFGLRQLARNGARVAARLALLLVPATALIAMSYRLLMEGEISTGPAALFALSVGLVAGVLSLYVAFWFSGMDALQHWCLRLQLSLTRRFPWRWVRFLEHAAANRLLLAVDGGYIFPHNLVRDYWATLGEPRRPASRLRRLRPSIETA